MAFAIENLFEKFQSQMKADPTSTQFLRARQSFEFLKTAGFPTRKSEDWRYTNLKDVLDFPYQPASLVNSEISAHLKLQIEKQLLNNAYNFVFLNGRLLSELSDVNSLSKIDGVEICLNPIKSTETRSPYIQNSFLALAEMFSCDHLYLLLKKDTILEKPVVIHNYVDLDSGPALLVQPHLEICLQKKSQLSLIETYGGQSGSRYLQNVVWHIKLEEASKLEHLRIQNESSQAFHFGQTHVQLEQHAQYNSVSASFGSLLSRHQLEVKILGEQTQVELNGVYVAQKNSQSEHYTHLEHTFGAGQSNQLYKGILLDSARAVFSGKIHIAKNAQKVNSTQLNQTLLLSPLAEINSKPILEIYADDVKATHGSTIGSMDTESLFYLNSRGLSRQKSLNLLCVGFLAEIGEKLADPNLRATFKKELNACMRDLDLNSIEIPV